MSSWLGILFFQIVVSAGPLLAAGAAGAQEKLSVDVVEQIGHSGSVVSVAFSPDGRNAVSAGGDIKLWDVGTGSLLRTFGSSDRTYTVAFSPDGQTIVSGGSDKMLKLWDARTGKLLRTLEGHSNVVNSVALTPDGLTVLSGSADRTLKLWETASGKLLRTFQAHSNVGSVSLSLDGRTAVSSGPDDHIINIWEVATGKLLQTLNEDPKGVARGLTVVVEGFRYPLADQGVPSVAFSPNGRTVLSGSSNRTLKLWDAATGKLLRTLQGHESGLTSGGTSVAFSSDGRLAISESDDRLKLWDVRTGRLLRTFGKPAGGVNSVVFSPDGHTVLSGGVDRTLKLWDTATGELLRTF
jgi:WD40 repeat protein